MKVHVSKDTSQRGFTIVELLIVIVIIGILAALVTIAYTGITARANDTSVQNDIRQSINKIMQYQVINGAYPLGSDTATLNTLIVASRKSYQTGANSYLFCRSNTDVALVARSASNTGFYFSATGGLNTLSSWPGNGNAQLCPAAGIPTSSPGYEFCWIYANGSWSSWFTYGA